MQKEAGSTSASDHRWACYLLGIIHGSRRDQRRSCWLLDPGRGREVRLAKNAILRPQPAHGATRRNRHRDGYDPISRASYVASVRHNSAVQRSKNCRGSKAASSAFKGSAEWMAVEIQQPQQPCLCLFHRGPLLVFICASLKAVPVPVMRCLLNCYVERLITAFMRCRSPMLPRLAMFQQTCSRSHSLPSEASATQRTGRTFRSTLTTR